MEIRIAEIDDLPELLAIYNDEVEHGVATLDITPQTLEQRLVWFNEHGTSHHPLICAVSNDGRIAGYASLSSYRSKEAYYSTVELSVYVAPEFRRRGVASQLMTHILDLARQSDSIHTVVSVITVGNSASIRLHETFGFTYCGRIRNVAVKFGRFLDIDNYQLMV